MRGCAPMPISSAMSRRSRRVSPRASLRQRWRSKRSPRCSGCEGLSDLTILVTGFSAFPGAPVNPSAAIVMRLLRRHARRFRLHGIRLQTAILPVVYDEVARELGELVARTHPDAILHLGLASRRKQVSVETRAVNRITTLHPDAARRRAPARAVRAGGEIGRAHV